MEAKEKNGVKFFILIFSYLTLPWFSSDPDAPHLPASSFLDLGRSVVARAEDLAFVGIFYKMAGSKGR